MHDFDKEEAKAQLWGSFLLFCKVFYPVVTGRDFIVSHPIGRESHFITIAKALTKVSRLEILSLIINVPPGSGKSTMLSLWVAWTMSRYPDSQYLYTSYAKTLAAKHTEFVRRIMQSREYKSIFDVSIKQDSRAKDFFQTNQNGAIKAFGSAGAITGQDAGLPNLDRFSGAVIIDDPHKSDEVHSDTMRESVIANYRETILQRPRGPNVPIIFIGQRLHEEDLAAFMMSGKDERDYHLIALKALDEAGNALYPEVNNKEQLLEKKEKNPYVFASQYQQDPIPSGGALFKPDDFVLLGEDPNYLTTFITVDTAETEKTYNDATVFSFWGLYQIEVNNQKLDEYALHWIDCYEIRVEPKHLQDEFMSFYADCMMCSVKPRLAAIEKKSTGVTLVSLLENMRGLEIRAVQRTKKSGSKTDRYLEMQPFIASKLISLTDGAKHAKKCIEHMSKITANDTHRWDDICDTAYDAVRLALIEKSIIFKESKNSSNIVSSLNQINQNRLNAYKRANYERHS